MVVLRRDGTVEQIADRVPCCRRTLYRMMDLTVQFPSKAMRAGIERIVDDAACHVAQPPDGGN